MSVLVVGLSHKSAPVSVLERAAVGGDTLGKLLHEVALLPDIAETFVISTCNRVEVYAEVGRFHGGVAGLCEALSRHSGIPYGPSAVRPCSNGRTRAITGSPGGTSRTGARQNAGGRLRSVLWWHRPGILHATGTSERSSAKSNCWALG